MTTPTPTPPPPPSADTCDNGYDWIDQLSDGWRPITARGDRLVGDWPLVVVAHYDAPAAQIHAIAVWSEGTVIPPQSFATAKERNAITATYLEPDEEDGS